MQRSTARVGGAINNALSTEQVLTQSKAVMDKKSWRCPGISINDKFQTLTPQMVADEFSYYFPHYRDVKSGGGHFVSSCLRKLGAGKMEWIFFDSYGQNPFGNQYYTVDVKSYSDHFLNQLPHTVQLRRQSSDMQSDKTAVCGKYVIEFVKCNCDIGLMNRELGSHGRLTGLFERETGAENDIDAGGQSKLETDTKLDNLIKVGGELGTPSAQLNALNAIKDILIG